MPEQPAVTELLAQVGQLSALNAELVAGNAELSGRNAEQARVIAEQAGALEVLRAQVAELSARLGQNPRNSSKPPSAEGLGKPPPRSLRRRSGRRPGGQPGHEGGTLAQVAAPDEVVVHQPACCRGCGAGLAGAAPAGLVRRQVFDLPPIRVRVVEHRLVRRRCGCGVTTCADAPAGVVAPVGYGPRISAIAVYLYVGQLLSKARTAGTLAELFGTPVSAGTVAAMTGRAADGLTGFLAVVTDRIAAAPVGHFDETGLRVQDRLRWVHSASTEQYSLITVHDKRGRAAMDSAGVLPRFTGIAVHDAWAPYDTYPAAHALCNAHVLRELQAVTDATGTSQSGAAGTWDWASQAADALRDLHHLVQAALAQAAAAGAAPSLAGLDQAKLAQQVHRYRSAALIGERSTAARSTKLMAKQHALARRLINRQDDYLRFTVNPAVPFDNNAAEREIRMIKLRQKVSGCLRTLTGAEQFCTIRSYLATAAKHRIHFYDALVQLTQGRPWSPLII